MASELPADGKCPSCRSALPPGVDRCPACGTVWGEDNRCPACHALAGVRATRDGFVCAACSAPRPRLPGTTLVGARPASPVAERGKATGLRVLGALAIGSGVLFATLTAAVVGGVAGVIGAAAVGALGVGGGMWLMRRSSRPEERAQAHVDASLQDLAAQRQGLLRAKDVAAALGISEAAAEQRLQAVADGLSVGTEVSDEGELVYRFYDAVPGVASIRARVAIEGASEDAEEVLSASTEARREAER